MRRRALALLSPSGRAWRPARALLVSRYLSLPIIRPLCSCSTPDVFVMEPTDARQLHHPSLVRPLDSPMLGCVFSQGQMCPGPVVVVNVLRQDPAKMPFANHDDVVKAFPSNRANHALGIGVLPRRSWRYDRLPDGQQPRLTRKSFAIDLIPVPDHMPRALLLPAPLDQLSC